MWDLYDLIVGNSQDLGHAKEARLENEVNILKEAEMREGESFNCGQSQGSFQLFLRSTSTSFLLVILLSLSLFKWVLCHSFKPCLIQRT